MINSLGIASVRRASFGRRLRDVRALHISGVISTSYRRLPRCKRRGQDGEKTPISPPSSL